MQYKSDSFEKFREFKVETKKQLVKNTKTLRSDRGGEYLSGEFSEFLTDNDILSQLTAPGMPQLNGIAKRRNMTLLDIVRSMLSYSQLLASFGGYALKTAMCWKFRKISFEKRFFPKTIFVVL